MEFLKKIKERYYLKLIIGAFQPVKETREVIKPVNSVETFRAII